MRKLTKEEWDERIKLLGEFRRAGLTYNQIAERIFFDARYIQSWKKEYEKRFEERREKNEG